MRPGSKIRIRKICTKTRDRHGFNEGMEKMQGTLQVFEGRHPGDYGGWKVKGCQWTWHLDDFIPVPDEEINIEERLKAKEFDLDNLDIGV